MGKLTSDNKNEFEICLHDGAHFAFWVATPEGKEYFSVQAESATDAWNKAIFHPTMQDDRKIAHMHLMDLEEIEALLEEERAKRATQLPDIVIDTEGEFVE